MPNFRAKVTIESVLLSTYGETITMKPVTNGTEEDNTYSKYTPSGEIKLLLTNPNLYGKIVPGSKYYVDFSEAE